MAYFGHSSVDAMKVSVICHIYSHITSKNGWKFVVTHDMIKATKGHYFMVAGNAKLSVAPVSVKRHFDAL